MVDRACFPKCSRAKELCGLFSPGGTTLAVKMSRQQKKMPLLASPSSAAALRAGYERAPEALRAAGLADRLKTAGFDVADLGDTATYISQPDDEHPRARNVSTVLKS